MPCRLVWNALTIVSVCPFGEPVRGRLETMRIVPLSVLAATAGLGEAAATGGLVFAKDGARTSWDAPWGGFQPRIGVAYQMHKVVLRA